MFINLFYLGREQNSWGTWVGFRTGGKYFFWLLEKGGKCFFWLLNREARTFSVLILWGGGRKESFGLKPIISRFSFKSKGGSGLSFEVEE